MQGGKRIFPEEEGFAESMGYAPKVCKYYLIIHIFFNVIEKCYTRSTSNTTK